MLVCPLGFTLVEKIFKKVAFFAYFLVLPIFLPKIANFLHGYICQIRDILQLWGRPDSVEGGWLEFYRFTTGGSGATSLPVNIWRTVVRLRSENFSSIVMWASVDHTLTAAE